MSPDKDTSPVPLYRQFLDHWFAPRWRALLTWVLLAVLVGAVMDYAGLRRADAVFWTMGLMNRLLPAPLAAAIHKVAFCVNFELLSLWVEPLALRLSLWRGLAWLSLRVAPRAAWGFLFVGIRFETGYAISIFCMVATCLVLWGWRSSPWMPLIGAALASVADLVVQGLMRAGGYLPFNALLPNWIDATVTSLGYAIPLLYGTSLLRPEERAQSSLSTFQTTPR